MSAANLRDPFGVVHYSFGTDYEAATTRCEATEHGYIEAQYRFDELRLTRAPVTCLMCLVRGE